MKLTSWIIFEVWKHPGVSSGTGMALVKFRISLHLGKKISIQLPGTAACNRTECFYFFGGKPWHFSLSEADNSNPGVHV